MVAISFSGGGLALAIVSIALYVAYQAIKPKPLPDIPYNKDAAGKLFGDVPEMMGYVIRTKRIFVRNYHGLPYQVELIYHAVCSWLICTGGG